MSDKEEGEPVQEKPFHVDRAKTGRSGCKKCKQKIAQGELRFAKIGFNPFGDANTPMKNWHHIPCIFDVFKRQRASTRKIENPDDIGGWENLSKDDQQEIMKYFTPELVKVFENYSPIKTVPVKNSVKETDKDHKDNSFRAFRKLCVEVADAASYLTKTSLIQTLLTKGSDGDGFKGNVELWCKLLLPGVVKRIYNLQSKQLVKIFSRILGTDHEEMLEDLEQGDVAETVSTFFEKSKKQKPASKAVLTLVEVDEFLEELSKLTKEDEQIYHFTKILKKCTVNDLKMIIRLIKHDLRISAGAKHILEALHPDAYKAFQASRDLKTVVENALKTKKKKKDPNASQDKGMDVKINIMTPVLPMLAQACTSVEMAFKKCPNGFYSEIKYDGERVQLHKKGNNFSYFSRSLKPVLPHKVNHFKDYIPKAFTHGKDLILDCEILLVDTVTGKPLPFGSLGKHKKNEFKDASVCLFVFDCVYYNGESLMDKTMEERKEILEKSMVEIKNHVMFSEKEEIHKPEDLEAMMTKVFKLGLEGLVLKDVKSVYEPGKRHWLKVKKDYLMGGAMADTADLVVLGAWFGTGNKGGIMSSFLMGCYDSAIKKWVTVTKVHGGHDDETLEKLQTELQVIKISKDPGKVPDWLKCTKTMIPDFVAKDPKNMPVWEITGAEFTKNQIHTASGISIRFPRVTKIRDDKDWKSHTNLIELKALFEKSKDTADFTFTKDSESDEAKSPVKGNKRKTPDESKSPEKGNKRKTPDESKSPERGNKRKTEANNKTPSKKAKMAEDKTPVKNAKVAEDDDETETETEEEMDYQSQDLGDKLDLENPLPDVFKNCVIKIPKDYKDYDLLKRYVVAYGGILHDPSKNTSVENGNKKITHMVHLKNRAKSLEKDSAWSNSVRHVHITWIWDSIKLLERQKEKNYTIKISDKR